MSVAKKAIGMSTITMQSIQGDANTAITAAGTTRATATALTNVVNIVTTATANQGVALDTGVIGDWVIVYNGTLVNVLVYPSSATAKINQITAGNAHTLPSQTTAMYFVASATQHVAFMSA